MNIPIQNIYYLLSYAWNHLEQAERVRVDASEMTKLQDLFARILVKGCQILFKRGIDKVYMTDEDEVVGIRGKILSGETFKRRLLMQQKTFCAFDELSPNTIANRVLVSTLARLSKTENIDKTLRGELVSVLRPLAEVDMTRLSPAIFDQIRYRRTDRLYTFLMDVCRIVHQNTLPNEEEGSFHFADFARDNHQMNQLFENFLLNFYKKEQRIFQSVGSEMINWQFAENNAGDLVYLPKMFTDITLSNRTEKLIVDAKYYHRTTITRFEKEKLHSNNLYQLFSYLLQQETPSDGKTLTATGMLLYPTIDKEYDLSYQYGKHNIRICTVNLDDDWQNIHQRLLHIIEP